MRHLGSRPFGLEMTVAFVAGHPADNELSGEFLFLSNEPVPEQTAD